MTSHKISYSFLWLGIALLPLLTIIMLMAVPPHDYWWYVRLGKDVLATGTVPVVDTYSSIQAGEPIVYQSWLSAVLFWVIYKAGGITLTVFVAALLIGITYTLLFGAVREAGAGARTAALLTLFAALAGSNNWTVRPQLFAYPLFLAALWLLLKWHHRSEKQLWGLVLLAWVWANLHGSFILFFVLAGVTWVFGKGNRKTLAWVGVACLAATLLNPRGFMLWQAVLGTFLSPGIRNLSPEWLPPLNEGWQMNIFFGWLIAMAPLAAFSQKRLTILEWVLFLAFAWLALTGTRYVIWSLFVMAILTARLIPESLSQQIDPQPEVKAPALNYLLGLIFIALPLFMLPGVREQWWQAAPPAVDPATPIAAAEWLNQNPQLSGPMWNDVVFGSYLIHAVSTRPVWFDTRVQVIFTTEQAQEYLFVQSANNGWEAVLEKRGINLLFLARTQPALVEAVQASPTWCGVYQDETALIFSRCEAK